MGSCLSSESRSPRPSSPLGIRKRKTPKKRPGLRNSPFDYRKEEQLHRIPGRMFLNGSSDVASLFTQQGKKGTNQDAMIVWEHLCTSTISTQSLVLGPIGRHVLNSKMTGMAATGQGYQNFGSRTDTVFCGVFDGHGPYGHMVAKRVRDSLPLKLSSQWDNIKNDEVLREISLNTTGSINSEGTSLVSADEESRSSIDVEETEKQPEIFQTLKESFLKAFKIMDRELKMYAHVDCFCSGTTAVTLVKQGQYLLLGNVGDSRAVLGTRDKNGYLVPVQLTMDLKPNLPAEAERIRKYKGRVFALKDEPEVARVWLPNNDSPGLAMARAFGDFCLKDYGLISVPEISHRCLTEKDEFVVLATDGIWDVLSNEEVVEIVASAPARPSAARALVESAVRAWRFKYPTSKVDDCAVVCLYLDAVSNNLSTASNMVPKEKITSMEQSNYNSMKNDPSTPVGIDGCGTIQSGEGVVHEENMEQVEDMEMDSEVDWSALEGVSRVNTLLTLPRYIPGKEEIASSETKARKR